MGNSRFHYRKAGELLHAARDPQHVLDETRRNLGMRSFEAQYQQSPVPEAGNLVRSDWFKQYVSRPARTLDNLVVQSWDTAMKGDPAHDYSVCTTWLADKGRHYLLDVTRKQLNYPDLRQLTHRLHAEYQPDAILIEDQGSGTTLIQDLRCCGFTPIAIRALGDKETRLSAASLIIEQGAVFLPTEAPWLASFLDEVLGFPQRRFDDQVDSLSQYLLWQRQRTLTRRFEYDFIDVNNVATPEDAVERFVSRRGTG